MKKIILMLIVGFSLSCNLFAESLGSDREFLKEIRTLEKTSSIDGNKAARISYICTHELVGESPKICKNIEQLLLPTSFNNEASGITLADAYNYGNINGIIKNLPKAIEIYESLSTHNSQIANLRLARIYTEELLYKDYKKARMYLSKVNINSFEYPNKMYYMTSVQLNTEFDDLQSNKESITNLAKYISLKEGTMIGMSEMEIQDFCSLSDNKTKLCSKINWSKVALEIPYEKIDSYMNKVLK